jgi:hypothetical protein
MTRQLTRCVMMSAIIALLATNPKAAKASNLTTKTVELMGQTTFPSGPDSTEGSTDIATTSSILMLDKKIYPLEKTATINVQGEKWCFYYRLDYQKGMFISNLKILDSKNVVLWEDKWGSDSGNLHDLLTSAETTNTLQWVKGIFGRKFCYGPHLKIRSIKKVELVPEVIEWSAPKVGMAKESLAKRLTNGSKLIVFDYRTTWREDMTVIAFLPEIRKFAAFSHGGY